MSGVFAIKIGEIAEIMLINGIDIAVLVETWLHCGIHDDCVHIPGYSAFRKDRADGRAGGGILVYVREGLPCQPQLQLDIPDIEVLWLFCTDDHSCLMRFLTF